MTSAVEARLDPAKLIEQACELAGSDDFGATTAGGRTSPAWSTVWSTRLICPHSA